MQQPRLAVSNIDWLYCFLPLRTNWTNDLEQSIAGAVFCFGSIANFRRRHNTNILPELLPRYVKNNHNSFRSYCVTIFPTYGLL